MKAYGINYISAALRHGDTYTSNDKKKNPKRKKSRSYNNATSKRVLRSVKKKERKKLTKYYILNQI